MTKKPTYEELEKEVTELRKSLKESRLSEKKYMCIFDSVPASVVIVDKNGKTIDINRYHITQTGDNRKKKKDYIGQNLSDVSAINNAGLASEYKSVIDGKSINIANACFSDSSGGADKYLSIRGEPVFDNDEQIGAIFVHEDHTDSKKAENVIRNREEQFRTLVETTNDWIWETQKGIFTYNNPRVEAVTGYTPEELAGESFLKYLHPDEKINAQDIIHRTTIQKKKPSVNEFRVIHKSGREIIIETSIVPYYDKNGVSGGRGVCRDITEKRKSEIALQESEEKHRLLLNHTDVSVSYFDTEGNLVLTNINASKHYGDSPENLKGKHMSELLPSHNYEEIRPSFDIVLETKERFSFIHHIAFTDIPCWFMTNVLPIINNDDMLIGIAVIAQDITDQRSKEIKLKKYRKHLEELVAERTKDLEKEIGERRRAEKKAIKSNSAKSEFLTNITHELRTPMHGIISFAELAIEKMDEVPKEKILHYLEQIKANSNRIMILINDIMDLSKLEAGMMIYEMKPENAGTVIRLAVSALSPLMRKKDITVTIQVPETPVIVLCDHNRIIQVMINLISNAINYSSEGKEIVISCEIKNVDINGKNTKPINIPGIYVSVKDQGVGIPEKELKKIFRKFIQSSKTKTGKGGTGLGLAICKEIIHAHNGKIWAENNPEEQGSVFVFCMPRYVGLKQSNNN